MKKLLNIDLHISVIADIINIFKVVDKTIEIEDWSLSGHAWILNKLTKELDILNSNTWNNLDINLVNSFQNNYDTILKTFDGFICCHPNSFILLFEKFNKPIYVINSCRYDMPFCWNNNYQMIEELHNCFIRLQDKNLLTVVSNNKADNAYFKLGNPTIDTRIIPSLCLYTGMQWNPRNTNDKFLLYSNIILPLSTNNSIVHRSQLGQYKWDTIMSFKGIIHFPYEASTMSIFEQISSEIPIFFPSKKFLKHLWENNLIPSQMNYWKHNQNSIVPHYLITIQNLDFWIENADYYDIEGYYYFDSFEYLFNMIETFNDELYETRKNFIRERKKHIIDSYSKIIK
jgi:hypothetical protein